MGFVSTDAVRESATKKATDKVAFFVGLGLVVCHPVFDKASFARRLSLTPPTDQKIKGASRATSIRFPLAVGVFAMNPRGTFRLIPFGG